MNIEYLYYFAEAARQGSISGAAHSYNISQQGLSRAIQCIENGYGIALFERKGNSISLTKAGEVFLEEAEGVIAAHNHLQESISCYAPKRTAWDCRINILMTLNVAFNVWPPLSKNLQQAFPNSLFSIQELHHDQIASKLCLYPSESTFALMSIPETIKGTFSALPLEMEPIMDVRLMAKVGKNSAYAQRETVSARDLQQAPLVMHDDPVLEKMLLFLTGSNSDELESTLLRTNSYDIMADGLKQFNAIGFSNTFCFHYNRTPDIAILPLEKSIRTPIYFVYNKAATDDSSEILKIKDFLLKTVELDFPLVRYKQEDDS
ncbi:LysR family transcriptional regulator [Gordonibacter sp. 28C]|uniref:LysR family transcriptional regulator n=1 Tax=Gordonibacter sp. 28C TaxID=2078569 RepID=UPI001314F57E|nr:LysR family transcriptional regulator [Gordonibacter sp. 28C]